MGLVETQIRLSHPSRHELSPVEAICLVDTAALMLCVPEHVAMQLQLETLHMREIALADGSKRTVPYVGPVKLEVANRACYSGALVLGDQVLLGAMPMEDMDLVVHPATRRIMPNPANPNLATAVVKGAKINACRISRRAAARG
jgi:clan AA aspartic protease